jgi:hypothetical protein
MHPLQLASTGGGLVEQQGARVGQQRASKHTICVAGYRKILAPRSTTSVASRGPFFRD